MNATDKYGIVGLNYVSMYLHQFEEALAWYTDIFGEPFKEMDTIYGWKLGSTWLTLLDSKMGTHPGSNPRNAEYAIQVSKKEMVDQLYHDFLAAGATSCSRPEDTKMYDPMRYAAVDDPFGMRIDIYCPIEA